MYLLAPVPAVSIGLFIASELGGGAGRLGFIAACAAIGSLIVLAAGRVRPTPERQPPPTRAMTWVAGGALAATASTLIHPGWEGVYRWVELGPVALHASLLLTPLVLLSGWRLAHAGRPMVGLGLVTALQIVHLAQPDAAQASGVAVAVAIGAITARVSAGAAQRLSVGIGAALLAALTWFRPDPLVGTVGVEKVVHTAFDLSPAIGFATVAALCALLVPFLMGRRPAQAGLPSASTLLAGYLAGVLLAAQFGDFPVLVVGYGASTMLGYYAAAAAAVWRTRASGH